MILNPMLSDQENYLALLNEATKSGEILYSPQSYEIRQAEVADGYLIPERQGHTATDVDAYFTPNWKNYLKGNFDAYKQGRELYLEYLKSPEDFIEYLWYPFRVLNAHIQGLKFMSLKTPWSNWAWVIDSLDTMSWDVAESHAKKLTKIERSEFNKQKFSESVTYEERLKYAGEHYNQVSEGMWVAKNDPGVMIYDPKVKPYGLKDGWSTLQLGEIIEEWAYIMTDEKLQSVLVKTDNED